MGLDVAVADECDGKHKQHCANDPQSEEPTSPVHFWLTNRVNNPTAINRASRIPTTNEITGCRLGLTSFDPVPFCAAPMPNQKRSLSIARTLFINRRHRLSVEVAAARLAPSGQASPVQSVTDPKKAHPRISTTSGMPN